MFRVLTDDSGDPDETSSTTGNNADVLPRVLTLLAFAMVLIVEIGNSFSQRFDTGSWTLEQYTNQFRNLKIQNTQSNIRIHGQS